MKNKSILAVLLIGLVSWSVAKPHDNVMSFDEMSKAFGWDFEKTEIVTQELGGGMFVMFGVGGNILVSVGDDGTMIVDDQFPQMMPKIQTALSKVGSKKVDYALNTHWHFDHAEGNLTLGNGDTTIVSQSNSRSMMLDDHLINFGPMAYEQKAYPEHALADITFNSRMGIHFNGEKVELMHYGVAHTTGDAAIWFRGHNVVHMGDVFNNSGYPFIDVDNGGRLRGIIEFSQKVYDQIGEKTIVVPGHGAVTDRAKLGRYIEVLTELEGRVQTLIDQGKDLDAIIAAKPSSDFDAEFKVPEFVVAIFLNRVYASMTAK
jgi:glyoxylase-like metal-dependent hydrolase (beta-lactamase superfamily II)